MFKRVTTRLYFIMVEERARHLLLICVRVCGVPFSNSEYKNQVNINTVKITSKFEKKLKRDTNIPCSMRGKILIINAVIFPILFYLATTFLPNKEFFRQFKTLLFSCTAKAEERLSSVGS